MGSVSPIQEIFQKLIEYMAESRTIHARYQKEAVNPGIRGLLNTIIQGEGEHGKELKKLIEENDLDLVFEVENIPGLDQLQGDDQYSGSTNINDILHTIMQRKKKTAEFLSSFSEACRNKDIAFVLTRLAFEEQKHYNWAVDQYELEMLME